MERKIGEVFEYNGEWYQCLENSSCCCSCDYCDFGELDDCDNIACTSGERSDNKEVYFKKLEKVGKPYEHYGKFYQCYKLLMETEIRLLPDNCYPIGKDNLVEIEIKQNKEDMEENKTTFPKEDNALTRTICAYVNGGISDKELIKSIKEMSDEYPYDKNELKPFDLESAKAGKPVCARDGRKARIIAFDANGSRPIVALVMECDDEEEAPYKYNCDGSYNCQSIPSDNDLMMLLEKRSGWAKIRKDINLYNTKEEADRKMIGNDEYVTAKVCWEE